MVGSFCKNRIKFQLKKYRRLNSHGIQEWWKFKEILTYGFKYDMKNLLNFHPTTQKSKNFTPMGYFCPKYLRFELKWYRGVICHETEKWCKIWKPWSCGFKNTWGIGWTFIIRAPKILKIVHWWALFVQSIYCFS